jgi:hypothetical protein
VREQLAPTEFHYLHVRPDVTGGCGGPRKASAR